MQEKLKSIENEGASFDGDEGNGFETPQKLETFRSFMIQLEEGGKMCHIGDKVKDKIRERNGSKTGVGPISL